MDILTLSNRLKEISLNHNKIRSYNIGNTWDMGASKSSDVYPAVWQEMPVLIEYSIKNKTYTFSLDILMLPKLDNVPDELVKQSECEQIADQLLQAYQKYIKGISSTRIVGLTVKNLNADVATGVRVDIQFITNRECEIEDNFNEIMNRE